MSSVDREGLKDRGIAGVLELRKPSRSSHEDANEDDSLPRSLNNKSVFDGLTANRRSCVVCGYTEAVMHFGFDNWQLALPRLAVSYYPLSPDLTFIVRHRHRVAWKTALKNIPDLKSSRIAYAGNALFRLLINDYCRN